MSIALIHPTIQAHKGARDKSYLVTNRYKRLLIGTNLYISMACLFRRKPPTKRFTLEGSSVKIFGTGAYSAL